MKSDFLVIYCDGGSRGNPGPAAWGSVIYNFENQSEWESFNPENPDKAKIYQELSEYVGVKTNNWAEWMGLVETLQYLDTRINLHETKIKIYLDSELVTKQVNKVYRVKSLDLKPLASKADILLGKFLNYEVRHIYRKYNTEADRLVNLALDKELK